MRSRTPPLLAALLAALAALMALALAAPAGAAAATCADYPNQAAAQEAADTIDADGDGIYCESLPCPCATGGGRGGADAGGSRPPASRRTRAQVIPARVLAVVDGDTIKVRPVSGGRPLTVRLIGIDTPERHGRLECGALEASRLMARLAWPGRRVTLRTDPTQDRTDRYGRLLAYVEVAGGSLQQRMLTAGWADVYVYRGRPFERVERFRATARRAERARRGVWGRCGGDFHKPLR